jgi:Ferredoxin
MNNNYNASTPETPQRHRIELADEQTCFNASSELSLLVAMERAGQALIPVGCRGGGCGKCRIRILKGEYFSKTHEQSLGFPRTGSRRHCAGLSGVCPQ